MAAQGYELVPDNLEKDSPISEQTDVHGNNIEQSTVKKVKFAGPSNENTPHVGRSFPSPPTATYSSSSSGEENEQITNESKRRKNQPLQSTKKSRHKGESLSTRAHLHQQIAKQQQAPNNKTVSLATTIDQPFDLKTRFPVSQTTQQNAITAPSSSPPPPMSYPGINNHQRIDLPSQAPLSDPRQQTPQMIYILQQNPATGLQILVPIPIAPGIGQASPGFLPASPAYYDDNRLSFQPPQYPVVKNNIHPFDIHSPDQPQYLMNGTFQSIRQQRSITDGTIQQQNTMKSPTKVPVTSNENQEFQQPQIAPVNHNDVPETNNRLSTSEKKVDTKHHHTPSDKPPSFSEKNNQVNSSSDSSCTNEDSSNSTDSVERRRIHCRFPAYGPGTEPSGNFDKPTGELVGFTDQRVGKPLVNQLQIEEPRFEAVRSSSDSEWSTNSKENDPVYQNNKSFGEAFQIMMEMKKESPGENLIKIASSSSPISCKKRNRYSIVRPRSVDGNEAHDDDGLYVNLNQDVTAKEGIAVADGSSEKIKKKTGVQVSIDRISVIIHKTLHLTPPNDTARHNDIV